MAAFFNKIFKLNHYEQNFNALNDLFWAVGTALENHFTASEFFPQEASVKKSIENHCDANQFILARFKDWVKESSKNDAVFAYFCKLALWFLPVVKLFREWVRHGNSKLLEALWLITLSWFQNLGRKNYRDEAFAYAANILFFWPTPVVEMLRRNRSISIKGARGHNIALDEFMEKCVVRPLKLHGKKTCHSFHAPENI